MAPAAPVVIVSSKQGLGWNGDRGNSFVRAFKGVPGKNQSPATLPEKVRTGPAKLASSRLTPHTSSLFLASGCPWDALVCGVTKGEC